MGTPPGRMLDTSEVNAARRYSHWMGGKDAFAPDRAAADEVREIYPEIGAATRANRAFLARAVRLAALHGRTQFVDVGCGLPLPDATHEVAQKVEPTARVAYVDNDTLVLVHARALYTSHPHGEVKVIDGDLRNPTQILADLESSGSTIDMRRPIVLVLGAVLHFLTDADKPREVVRVLMDALAPGSVLIVSHASYEPLDEETRHRLTTATITGVGTFTPRSGVDILDFFQGVELIQPGLVVASLWRPHPKPKRNPNPEPPANRIAVYGGVGVKTGRRAHNGAHITEIPT
jgi:SAM-dependent methyltransferase